MLKKCSPWCILRECRGMPNHDQQALCTREGHVESSLVGQEADALATRVVGRAHRAEEDHLALASLVRIDGLHVVTASNLLAKSILLRSVRREDPHVSNHVRFLFGGSLLEAGNDHRAHSHFEYVLPGPVGTLGRGLQVKEQKWGEDSVKGTSGVLQHARGIAESSAVEVGPGESRDLRCHPILLVEEQGCVSCLAQPLEEGARKQQLLCLCAEHRWR